MLGIVPVTYVSCTWTHSCTARLDLVVVCKKVDRRCIDLKLFYFTTDSNTCLK